MAGRRPGVFILAALVLGVVRGWERENNNIFHTQRRWACDRNVGACVKTDFDSMAHYQARDDCERQCPKALPMAAPCPGDAKAFPPCASMQCNEPIACAIASSCRCYDDRGRFCTALPGRHEKASGKDGCPVGQSRCTPPADTQILAQQVQDNKLKATSTPMPSSLAADVLPAVGTNGLKTTCRLILNTDKQQQEAVHRNLDQFKAAFQKDVGLVLHVAPSDFVVTDVYRGGGFFRTLVAFHTISKDDVCSVVKLHMDRGELTFGAVEHFMQASFPISATTLEIVERAT